MDAERLRKILQTHYQVTGQETHVPAKEQAEPILPNFPKMHLMFISDGPDGRLLKLESDGEVVAQLSTGQWFMLLDWLYGSVKSMSASGGPIGSIFKYEPTSNPAEMITRSFKIKANLSDLQDKVSDIKALAKSVPDRCKPGCKCSPDELHDRYLGFFRDRYINLKEEESPEDDLEEYTKSLAVKGEELHGLPESSVATMSCLLASYVSETLAHGHEIDEKRLLIEALSTFMATCYGQTGPEAITDVLGQIVNI